MPQPNLLTAGSNSHSELQPSHRSDLRTFVPINAQSTRTLLFPHNAFPIQGSTAILDTATNILHSQGDQRFSQPLTGQIAENLTQPFGDYDGMAGCLDTAGNLYLIHITSSSSTSSNSNDDVAGLGSWVQQRTLFHALKQQNTTLDHAAWKPHLTSPESTPRPAHRPKWTDVPIQRSLVHVPSAPKLEHIAYVSAAGNGDVVLVLKQESGDGDDDTGCQIVQLKSLDDFYERLDRSSTTSITTEQGEELTWTPTFVLPGRAKQLVGSWGIFLLLMESGEVYSWGDARFACLGRSVTGEGATPAQRPGLVDALGGIKVVKVAAGGWMRAAVSEDGAGYIWGCEPNFHRTIKPLRDIETGGIALITLSEEEWDLDVLDVAIGRNHVVVLDGSHRVWVIGENDHGQLGLGIAEDFLDDWTCVPSVRDMQSVACGMHTTYITGTLV